MTVEQAVETYLGTVAAVTSLVPAARIYQLKLPQTPRLPAIRLQVISEPKTGHLRGRNNLTRSRVQVDVYGSETVRPDPYDAIGDIAKAVEDALMGEGFEAGGLRITGVPVGDRRVGIEAETFRAIRSTQDFAVWFKEL